jgi:hypothetical protein
MKRIIMAKDFDSNDKIKCLLWCDRHCCLCGKACGTNIEVHHIIPKEQGGTGNINNAIPLCFDCHSEVGCYNVKHPTGNKYKPEELKARREQIYEEHTRHLVPPIWFDITQDLPNGQKRNLPDVGINVTHFGDSLPVKFSVAAQVFLGDTDLGIVPTRQYTGERLWNLNPRFGVRGHFSVPSEVVESTERLEIRVTVIVVDQYEREHQLLPLAWVYMKDSNSWYLEPCGNDT